MTLGYQLDRELVRAYNDCQGNWGDITKVIIKRMKSAKFRLLMDKTVLRKRYDQILSSGA